METRIKTILKGLRKFKGVGGHLKIVHFERLPDKAAYPDYYMEIKEPIAIDIIKRKSKRKKYNSVDHFMRDLDLMFENAKSYNQSESQIYKDAVDLQTEARKLAEQEKKKPDSEYLMEDGRFPLPDGILHRNELWKVGDWVHIQNPNDVTKPIVAQIYRTWEDSEREQWINACWYYRPEQTVHHFEKHFYPNEVVKTGQYRDHRIDEIVDRCFVMFFTRYSRGRPRDLPPGKEIYVCEARYNEEKHKLNKIKTWASCLPDEVREKDYEMDLFDVPRKIRKNPTPIKHLLKDDAKETDDLPRPTWGADNAPPVVGAVHRRPRDENVSLPFVLENLSSCGFFAPLVGCLYSIAILIIKSLPRNPRRLNQLHLRHLQLCLHPPCPLPRRAHLSTNIFLRLQCLHRAMHWLLKYKHLCPPLPCPKHHQPPCHKQLSRLP